MKASAHIMKCLRAGSGTPQRESAVEVDTLLCSGT